MQTLIDLLQLIAAILGLLFVVVVTLAFLVAAIAPPLAMAYFLIKLAFML